jgi:hypothetical protein
VSLVGQGAVLPAVMRSLGLANASRRERQTDHIAEQEARREAAQTAIKLFDRLAKEKALPKKFVETFRATHLFRLLPNEVLAGDAEPQGKLAKLRDEIDLELLSAERVTINDLYCDNKLTDEARRRLEKELDLREADVANSRDKE